MKQIFSSLLMLGLFFSAQSQDFKIKKDVLYSNDTAICRIEKIKQKGFLSIPNFEIQSLEGKPLATLYSRSLPSKVYVADYTWYSIVLSDGSDSVQLLQEELMAYNKGFLIQRDDILAKMVLKYTLVKDNAIVPASWEQLKKEYPADQKALFVAKVEKEGICIERLKQPAASIAEQEITVTVASQSATEITYEIKQNDKVVATVTAKGTEKSLKDESAEHDYSSGIGSLDGIKPLNYVFYTTDGCPLAEYYGEEKMTRTRKDALQHAAKDMRRNVKINSRLDYVTAIAKYLFAKRYF
ncbi:MAG: hypothetical protein K0Q66_489 [Chitinophagaceae bacterium]|jgi:hypothetical protein|nr:hypothetical protein [Chitinophagaceae bacterium]